MGMENSNEYTTIICSNCAAQNIQITGEQPLQFCGHCGHPLEGRAVINVDEPLE
jgi:hypothetical protein